MSTPHDIITIHINIICKKLKSFEALRLVIIFIFQFIERSFYVYFTILFLIIVLVVTFMNSIEHHYHCLISIFIFKIRS
ncbi:hypothetical protein CD116_06600 [Staphylococcus schweitzeri]|uniref:Uncharacterized protein n=1 Tax=Staphylococcus schweitzeri TaxID=1654388 RepID=A0A2K4AHF1_9STAP|nr:hypothetical protein CD116_06600 [Staphylococcus schweitzeri]